VIYNPDECVSIPVNEAPCIPEGKTSYSTDLSRKIYILTTLLAAAGFPKAGIFGFVAENSYSTRLSWWFSDSKTFGLHMKNYCLGIRILFIAGVCLEGRYAW
jgi:hypothetical protein